MKKYIVVATAFEYNDEYYSSIEGGVEVEPKIYSKKEDAIEARNAKLLDLPSNYWRSYHGWVDRLSESAEKFILSNGFDPHIRWDWDFEFDNVDEVITAHRHFGWDLPHRVMELEEEDSIESFEEIVKHFGSKAKELLAQGFKAIFQSHPDVKSITWFQYTPYFNDGDECVFHVDDDNYSINGIGYYDAENEEPEDGMINVALLAKETIWTGERSPNPVYDENYAAIPEKISALLSSNSDLFKAAFGDHVEVTATPEGFETEEYNHD